MGVERGGGYENRNAGLGSEQGRDDHRAFATDHYQRLDLMTPQVAGCEAASGRRAEFRRARGFQEGAAALNHVGDGSAAERLCKGADEALVAAPKAEHLDAGDCSAADHRANGSVHTGSIAARGKNCDSARSPGCQVGIFAIAIAVHGMRFSLFHSLSLVSNLASSPIRTNPFRWTRDPGGSG